jgi:hypothetical protein
MDPGDILSLTIASVSLIATATLAYRQTRMQARLTAIEKTRRHEQIEARQHADVQAMVAGTPTALQLVLANDGPATAREVWATELPVGSDDPPLFHGLDELEQAPATLRPGDRLPFPVLTLAENTERVQVVVSWSRTEVLRSHANRLSSTNRISCAAGHDPDQHSPSRSRPWTASGSTYTVAMAPSASPSNTT